MNKKFKAVVDKDSVDSGTLFSVTHNGTHWTSIRIENPLEEIPLMIFALQSYLTGYCMGVIKTVKEKYSDPPPEGCTCSDYPRMEYSCPTCGDYLRDRR